MFNVGGGEVLVILLLALIVLGPDKLPQAAKQAGKYLSEFRRMSNGFQQELRDAMDLTPSSSSSRTTPSTSVATPVGGDDEPARPVVDGSGTNLDTDAPHVAPAMRTPPPEVPGGIAVEGPSTSFS